MSTELADLLGQALGLSSGESPFPWQLRLLQQMLTGDIPSAIEIPTGIGKTSVMAIWLVARAEEAKVPRRLVYVVDRRAVVDQATEVALLLRDFVEKNPSLKSRLGLRDSKALAISTLRGQYVDNREWLEDPAAPAVVVGTVDMIGSRVLFEGYGVSRKMRPYHAGLLGVDTLVVLDEAHLVPPFEHLLRSVADLGSQPHANRYRCAVPPFRVLSLSATGRVQRSDVFTLNDEDLQHAVVQKRLHAKKSLYIESIDERTRVEDALADLAWELTNNGQNFVRVLVYADSREVARKAKQAVEKLAKGNKKLGKPEVKIETELLVGGRRVFEREQAKERLKSLGFIAGSSVERSAPVFLFATSAGEVGVDLDADHMVCDLVRWERMVQRLGRVNRRGTGEAIIKVIGRLKPSSTAQQALDKRDRGEKLTDEERKKVDEYEKACQRWNELYEALLKPLEHLPHANDGSHDASPHALYNLKERAENDVSLKGALEAATTPEPMRPALTRALVEAWAMTSLEEHTGRPEIQPWLRGWVKEEPQTAVIWRKYLPVRADGPETSKKEVEAFFEAAPPHTSELLETETSRVVEWLTARAKSVLERQGEEDVGLEAAPLRNEDVVAFALSPEGYLRRAFTLEQLANVQNRNHKERLGDVLKSATLIVDARLGGLRGGLLDEAEDAPPRTADDGQEWLGEGVVGFRVRNVAASDVPSDIPETRRIWYERLRFPTTMTDEGEVESWLFVEQWRHYAANEEDRSAGNPQRLGEHQKWVEKCARDLAERLGLPDELKKALELAARFHDEGKRAVKWQRSFHAPTDDAYAKTLGPIDYRLLDGYRHELGSLLRLEKNQEIQNLSDELRDLVLHLVAAHHGFARPVIGITGCEDSPPSVLKGKASEIALRFAHLQERWGPWGLAWLEALLRAADHQASRDNDARAATKGGE